MNQDQWLRELAQVAREEQGEPEGLDGRWDRLSAGELSADEEAELRALAEGSPQAREAYEAFRPLGADFQERIVQAVRAEPEAPPGRVLPFRRLASLKLWLPAAAAAAIAFALLRPASPPPLPGYAIALSGGIRETRGEPAPRFAAGRRFEILLRPETAVAGKLEARCCFLERGPEWQAVPVPAETAPGGAVRFRGTLPAGIAAGDWTVWALVGRPGALPDEAGLREAPSRPGKPIHDRDWAALNISLKIE